MRTLAIALFVLSLAACRSRDEAAPTPAATRAERKSVERPIAVELVKTEGATDGTDMRKFAIRMTNTGESSVADVATCTRLLDSDGMELKQSNGEDIALQPGDRQVSTDTFLVDDEVWRKTVSVEIYVAHMGCASPRSEAVSPVVRSPRS